MSLFVPTWCIFGYTTFGEFNAFESLNALKNIVCLEATYFKHTQLILLTNVAFGGQTQHNKNDVMRLEIQMLQTLVTEQTLNGKRL